MQTWKKHWSARVGILLGEISVSLCEPSAQAMKGKVCTMLSLLKGLHFKVVVAQANPQVLSFISNWQPAGATVTTRDEYVLTRSVLLYKLGMEMAALGTSCAQQDTGFRQGKLQSKRVQAIQDPAKIHKFKLQLGP